MSYAPNDKRFDICCFDFDIDFGQVTDGVENSLQRGNLDAVGKRESAQLRGGEAGYFPARLSGRVHIGIVVYDDNTIARGVHIELDCVCSKVDRSEKGGDRILRQRLVRAAVRYLFGLHDRPYWSEGFLRVVALGTMSAKHMSAVRRGQSALTAGLRERLPDEAP